MDSKTQHGAVNILAASDSSLLVSFGQVVELEVQQRVLALFHALQHRRDLPIRNLHPGYGSLLVDFDPLQLSHPELAAAIERLAEAPVVDYEQQSQLVRIPVCYDAELGPDLLAVAEYTRLTVEELVGLHSSALYTVYFLGFSPGFTYLGGLPNSLQMPRLPTPRARVAAGSVGIAGNQTGIYPMDSAGGWRLIGRTPLRMFDPAAAPPTRVQPGDQVQFHAIDRAAFEEMRARS